MLREDRLNPPTTTHTLSAASCWSLLLEKSRSAASILTNLLPARVCVRAHTRTRRHPTVSAAYWCLSLATVARKWSGLGEEEGTDDEEEGSQLAAVLGPLISQEAWCGQSICLTLGRWSRGPGLVPQGHRSLLATSGMSRFSVRPSFFEGCVEGPSLRCIWG